MKSTMKSRISPAFLSVLALSLSFSVFLGSATEVRALSCIPNIVFSSPANGGVLDSGRQVAITATICGINPRENSLPLYIDGILSTDVTLNYDGTNHFTGYTNTRRLTDGAHTLATQISNFANTQFNATATVYIGVTPPAPVLDTIAPTAPTLSGIALLPTAVKLMWSGSTDNVGVTGYSIYRDGVFLIATSATSYIDQGLTNPSYIYFVKAFDAAGNTSLSSNSVNISMPTSPVLPTINFTVSTSTINQGDSALLTINVTNADTITIDNGIGGVSASSTRVISPLFSTTYTLTATNIAGVSTSSVTVLVLPPAPDILPPTAPTLSGTAFSSSTIGILWLGATDNVGVTGYNIYRDGTLLISGFGNQYIDTGLTASTTYSYYVTAFDAAGNTSTSSNVITKTTLPGSVASSSIVFAAPTPNQNVGSSRAVQITLNYNGFTPAQNSTSLLVDGVYGTTLSQLTGTSSGVFTGYLNTRWYSFGGHTLSASILDNMGVTQYATTTIQIP